MERPHPGWWIAIIAGMSLTGLLALHDASYALWAGHVTTLLPRPLLQAIFAAAVTLHVGESLFAFRLARRLGLPAAGWGAQTLVLGFASLRLLLARRPRG